jgi:hypothetical protein
MQPIILFAEEKRENSLSLNVVVKLVKIFENFHQLEFSDVCKNGILGENTGESLIHDFQTYNDYNEYADLQMA